MNSSREHAFVCVTQARRDDHASARAAARNALIVMGWSELFAVASFEGGRDEPFTSLCQSYVHLLAEHNRILAAARAAAARKAADPRD